MLTTLRPPVAPPDVAAARRQLRDQVARLERTRSALAAELPAHRTVALGARPRVGARLLDLCELETERDRLVGDVARLRDALSELGAEHAVARRRLQDAIADPGSARWLRISNRELGLPGCGAYSVRPRLGLLGMLLDWWVVKVSSGCP